MNVHKHARKAEWESLPFIVKPLRDWYIISLTGLKQRPSYKTDWYTLILVSVNRVRVRGMLSTKWRNSLLLPLALSTGRPGNSVDSNLVWRCACRGLKDCSPSKTWHERRLLLSIVSSNWLCLGFLTTLLLLCIYYRYCDDLAGRFLLKFWMVIQAEWQRYVHVWKSVFIWNMGWSCWFKRNMHI